MRAFLSRVAGFVVYFVCLAATLAQSVDADLERHYERARRALEKQDYGTAAVAWKAIVDLAPGLPEARSNLGLMYHQQRKFDLAIEQFREALRLNPDVTAASLFLGIDYYLTSRPSLAAEHLARVTALEPTSPLPRKWLAMSYLQLGNLAQAISELKQAMRLDPKDSELAFHLGRTYLKVATAAFQSLRRRESESPWLFLLRGEQFVDQRKWDEAVVELRHAQRLAAELPLVHYRLAQLYEARRDSSAALDAYFLALRNIPVHADAADGLARLLLRSGWTAEAEELKQSAGRARRAKPAAPSASHATPQDAVLNQAATPLSDDDRRRLREFLQDYRVAAESYSWNVGPWQRQARDLLLAADPAGALRLAAQSPAQQASAETRYWKARAHLELGQLEEALRELMSLGDSPPENPEWAYYLQRCAEKLAVQTLEAFSRQEPNSPRTYQLQAEYNAAQGDVPKAIETYQKALQLKPGAAQLQLAIGDLHFGQREYDKALASYQAELKNDPYSVAALTRAGDVCRLTARPEEAQRFLSRALEIHADSGPAHEAMGNLLFDQGKFSDAVEHLEAALRAGDPDDETLHYRLGRAYHLLGNRQKADEHLAAVKKLQQRRSAITQERIEAAVEEKRDDP